MMRLNVTLSQDSKVRRRYTGGEGIQFKQAHALQLLSTIAISSLRGPIFMLSNRVPLVSKKEPTIESRLISSQDKVSTQLLYFSQSEYFGGERFRLIILGLFDGNK